MSKLTEYIVDNVDIVDVISRRVNLKRAGSNFSGLSPFQNEKTPSFMVSPQKQIFKDFSSGVGGNVITFVMEYEKIDFMDAIKLIADENRLDISEFISNSNYSKEFQDDKEKIKRIHNLSQNFFVNNLNKSKEALLYLKDKRGLSDHLIKNFGIGFAPDSHYELIQELKGKGFSDIDIAQSSLSKKGNSDYFGFFRNRITFPIYDTRNNIVGFSARVLDPKDQPKYLNSSEHPAFEKSKILYGLNFARNNIKIHDMLILVEGQMDVIALAKLNLPIGVATCGTAVTDNHIKLIKRYTDNVYILFDNDDAGRNATVRALKITYRENVFPKMIILPSEYKDVDDLANVNGGLDIFKSCISDSKDAFLQIYDLLKKKYDMSSPIDKQKLFNDMFSLIICVDNYTIQEHYKQVLADKVGLPYEVISMQFAKYAKTDGRFEMRKKQNSTEKKSWQPDRDYVCASLFYDNFLDTYIKTSDLLHGLLSYVNNIGKNMGDGILKKVILDKNNLNSKEKDLLNQTQLRWDKELTELSNDKKRYFHIKTTISSILKEYLKQILKSPNIDQSIKQDLLNNMKKF